MSALDKLGDVDKLLGLTPFFRCPHCGKRDEDGAGSPTFFILRITATMPVTVDEAGRRFEADRKDLEIDPAVVVNIIKDKSILICNDCQWEFEIPPDWTVSY